MTGETDRTGSNESTQPPSSAPTDGEYICWPPHARFRPHTPARPSFRCRACGAPWPCQPARLSLLLVYQGDRLSLLMYLACQLHRALHDLPSLDPAALSVRFLGWVPRRLS